MGEARNLSFSTVFNQQKYILNDATTTNIASSASIQTLYTLTTDLTRTTSARMFIEYTSTMIPAYGLGAPTFRAIGKEFAFFGYFNTSFDFVVQVYAPFDSASDVTIYTRIYQDGRSS